MAQQAFRRKVKQELEHGKGAADVITAERLDSESIRRKLVKKWSPAPLGEVIKKKRLRRIRSYRRKKDAKLERDDT